MASNNLEHEISIYNVSCLIRRSKLVDRVCHCDNPSKSFFLKNCSISPSPGILDTLAEEEESNSENEDDFVDIDLVALQVAA